MQWISRSIRVRLGILAFLLTVGVPTTAPAHLSIIRQGVESRGVPEDGDAFGEVLAAGDFNGDGYDDLATGAPWEAVGSLTSAGAVIINWGTEFGLTHVGAVLITANEMATAEAFALFGASLAAGDFNDDGYDDLAIGSPLLDGSAADDVGGVYVMRGSASGLVNWHSLLQSHLGGSIELNDMFGTCLVAGDLNADGIDDLAIGSTGEDNQRGAVFFILGTGGGLFGNFGWFKSSTVGDMAEPGDNFGHTIAIGNVMLDGHAELIVSAPFADVGTQNSGRIYVLPGTATGPTATGNQKVDGRGIDGPTSQGKFGFGLAAGRVADVNGGYDCLIVGEPGWDYLSANEAGRVHVLPGGATAVDIDAGWQLTEFNFGATITSNDRFGWVLAVGHFEGVGPYEDVAFGSPFGKWEVTIPESGEVRVSYGGPDGPGQHGYAAFNQQTLGDAIENEEHLGAALTFGQFDGTGNGHLVAGAPGEDEGAGQVHVIAPWRQAFDLLCRHSIATDCDGNLIFTQKAFDEIHVASTTKILSVLVGCEFTQLPPGDPDYIDPDAVYDIPNWVVDDIGGSSTPLWPGEQMSFRNLLFTCLIRSGNDSGYAFAHIAGGGGSTSISLPTFVAAMNAKAAEIGMTSSHFSTPSGAFYAQAGPDLGDNYSTPEDMAKLGRAAMQNELFREIVATTDLTIERTVELYGSDVTFEWSTTSVSKWIVDSAEFPLGSGIKGGYTSVAGITGVYSADMFLAGRSIAGSFNTTKPNKAFVHPQAFEILSLGVSACGESPVYLPFDDPFVFSLSGLSSYVDAITGGSLEHSNEIGQDAVIDLWPAAGNTASSMELLLRHTSEVIIEEIPVSFGLTTWDGHDEIVLLNESLSDASVSVDLAHLGTFDFVIPPGGRATTPSFVGATGDFHMEITKTAGSSAILTVEIPLHIEATLPPGPSSAPGFTIDLGRDPALFNDQLDLLVLGHDTTEGNTFTAVVHSSGTVLDIEETELETPTTTGALTLRPAHPNPFRSGTTIAFELSESGPVDVHVFDVGGRLVRSLVGGSMTTGAQTIKWDGRAENGALASPGMYFYTVRLADKVSRAGRLVRLP